MAEFRDSIDIAAPPETVFEYLTTNDGMTAWMGQYADLDPRPGGGFAVDIAGHPVRGEYLHVDFPSRVVVSWGFAGSDDLPAGASTVEFRLTATDAGTRVDLRHSDLPDAEVRGHAYGWAHFLPRLAAAGAGGDAGPDDWRPLER
ncbi:MAG: SRPBCC domain-containing protein [Leucobacter sp.]